MSWAAPGKIRLHVTGGFFFARENGALHEADNGENKFAADFADASAINVPAQMATIAVILRVIILKIPCHWGETIPASQ